MSIRSIRLPQLFLRIALAFTMLSAVADRLGFWGAQATWGTWQHFEQYTATLTFFLPAYLSAFSAYAATFMEVALSLLLLSGFKLKWTAIATGILLLVFALSMSISLGVKAPLDYSVWIGSAAAFLLASQKSNAKRLPDGLSS
ncbi:DoxX family membrane protein [Taibaiella koreensis]|uniref:DoxX family membrane protein n=1 Tax=Taibaiella koreensis TaxID=1268548 RepID=UPI000E59CCD0|nr:DoxX family membrane protein [Taibaiella koreensis]